MSGSISTKPILNPHKTPQFAVATKELGVVQNKSSDFNDNALQAKSKAELPLLTTNAYLLFTKSFILFSNSIVFGPWVKNSDFRTLLTFKMSFLLIV